MSVNKCPGCNTEFIGEYCYVCGEQKKAGDRRDFFSFLEDAVSSLFIADGKFPRTIRLLLTRPGALSGSYMSGVRKKFISPIQLFFFANLIYFLFPMISTFNTTLDIQMNGLPYSRHIHTVVDSYLAREDISIETYEAIFDRRSESNAKLVLIILVVLNAVFMKLLFLRSRRFYFLDFMTTSAYFYSFYILVGLVSIPLLFRLVSWVFNFGSLGVVNEFTLTMVFLTLTFIYFFFQLRRAFQINSTSSAWRSLVLTILMIPGIIIYRYLLFWVTFLMTT